MITAEFLIKIADIRGVLCYDAVGNAVCVYILLILLGYIQHICPLVSRMSDGCPRLAREGKDTVPVVVYPHAAQLLFYGCKAFLRFAIQLAPDPAKEPIPRV